MASHGGEAWWETAAKLLHPCELGLYPDASTKPLEFPLLRTYRFFGFFFFAAVAAEAGGLLRCGRALLRRGWRRGAAAAGGGATTPQRRRLRRHTSGAGARTPPSPGGRRRARYGSMRAGRRRTGDRCAARPRRGRTRAGRRAPQALERFFFTRPRTSWYSTSICFARRMSPQRSERDERQPSMSMSVAALYRGFVADDDLRHLAQHRRRGSGRCCTRSLAQPDLRRGEADAVRRVHDLPHLVAQLGEVVVERRVVRTVAQHRVGVLAISQAAFSAGGFEYPELSASAWSRSSRRQRVTRARRLQRSAGAARRGGRPGRRLQRCFVGAP